MSGSNSSNNDNRSSGEEEGWGSKFLKVAGAVAAAATVAGGLLAVVASASSSNSNPEQVPPFGSRAPRVTKEPNENQDPWSLPRETPSSKVQWTKPAPGWVKLNVDGSRDHIGYPNSTGCGGVLRDSSGTWLYGFAQKLDPTCKIHAAEIYAILKGLELAREMNVEKLVVESDHKPVVKEVNGPGRKCSGVISQIRQLLEDTEWQVKVVDIPREANRVANRLANDARDLPDEKLQEYRDPPKNCARLLNEDAQPVSNYY